MAHGINPINKRETDINKKVCLTDHHLHHHHHHQHPAEHIMLGANSGASHPSTATKMGSRRIFTPQFKLQVLDSYRNDSDCKGNQRATARKYGIHRRQIQKWLQCETNLRSTVSSGNNDSNSTSATKIGASEVKSNNQNQHHITSTTTTTITSATTTNGNQQQLQQPHLSSNTNSSVQESLDKVSRHSVELCNKSNNGFLSPVHSHLLEYTTPVAYESQQHQHVVHTPSASLPSCSPVFSNPVGNVGGSNNISGANAVIPYDLRDYYPHYLVAPTPHHQQQLQYAHHDELMSATTLHPPHYSDIGTTPQGVYTTYGYEMTSVIVAPSATPPLSAMDLSMHGRQRDVNCERKQITQMPVTCHAPQRTQNPAPKHLSPVTTTDENAWDLSARKRKCDDSLETKNGTTPPKVVKLFKPYLLSDDDDDFDVVDKEENKKFTKHRQQHDPIIWSNYTTSMSSPASYDPSSYSSSSMSCSPPITDLNNNNLAINSSRCSTSLGSPHYDATYHPMASYGSPVSGYDTASSYSSSSECGDSMPPRNTSYAVELKILAIDSYYNDQMCRGNEEAVADKYSVHRRQVQQWLMQEDHLRNQ